MLVVLFRSKLTTAAGADYSAMDAMLFERVRGFPGFIAVKSFLAEDGERLTVVWFRDEETLKAWREDARHRVAQQVGRERWYEYYDLEVAEVIRTSRFARTESEAAATPAPRASPPS
jgi:heme-degrading monooxygenase HmoA